MASSCPSTRGLDGGAPLDQLPDEPSAVVTSFSFTDATKPTITTADLAPTRRPHPRPWQRIPVPGAGNKLGLRKVWKRIGGVPRSSDDTRYVKGIIELRADGQGPRKIRRTERHVPVWGDAQWKTSRSSDGESIEEDLVKARETVVRLLADTAVSEPTPLTETNTNPLGCSLTFVPRKRNSRRQPFTVSVSLPPPTALITAQCPIRAATTVDESIVVEDCAEHITKRAKRRMSRRISILPRLEGGLLSPEKRTVPPHVFSSPVKRLVSMESIHEPLAEPVTPGTPATPVASIAPPISFAPTFSSPIKSLAPITEMQMPVKEDQAHTSGPVPMSPALIFDRPAVEIETESPHEIRRRMSLHNTRRRETWLSAAAVERESPEAKSALRFNRRHSFLPQHTPLVFAPTSTNNAASRRHTFQPGALGIFLTSFDKSVPELDNVPSIIASESENTASTIELSGLDESTVHDAPIPTQDETVVVDVRTNLDIFRSGPPVQTHHSPKSDHHVSFDLKDHTEKTPKFSPTKRDNKATKDGNANTPASSSNEDALLDVPKSGDTEKPNRLPLDTLNEEDTLEVSNDSTPRSLSPDMDIDISEEDSCEVTDDMRIVSTRPSSSGLDKSLLLPLPETTETETETETTGNDYGWQSPTSAELGHLADLLDTPQQGNPIDVSVSSPSSAQIDIDMELLLEDDDDAEENDEIAEEAETAEDAEDVQDVEDVEDEFTASPSNMEDLEDSPSPAPSVDEENGEYTLTQPINMFSGVDEDATTTMTMDFDNLTDDQLSAHEDSETEMLRKFVTRVKADKSAKAAAAAEAASARSLANLQRKRRSGSTGSTASSSGSPMTKREGGVFASPFTSLEARVPFGKKDHNMSPSPRKKRRTPAILDASDENRSHDLLSKPSFDDNSPPRPKRRRKKMEADTGGVFNPEFMSSGKEDSASEGASGPRRSKRTRSSQTPLKSAAATANSALSLIPVRLPGSLNLNGDDSYGLSASSLSLRRNDEKDLAATTRVNTRKNKGNADPPCIVVARQSHEALRAMREQKSVFDSPLIPQETSGKDKAEEDNHGKSRKTKKASKPGKSVRWAEILARFQTSDGETAEKGAVISDIVDSSPDAEIVSRSSPTNVVRATPSRAVEKQAPVEVAGSITVSAAVEPEITTVVVPAVPAAAPPPPPAPAAAPQQGDAEKTSIPRRTTRVSRLQPPTPRKVIASAAAAKAAAIPTPAPAPVESAPMGLKALPSGGASAKRMATRRAKIVGMGMAGNGTPAPKRRTTRTT